jgi:hypothetical protein
MVSLQQYYTIHQRQQKYLYHRIKQLVSQYNDLTQLREQFIDQFEVVVNLTMKEAQDNARNEPERTAFYKQNYLHQLELLQQEFEPFEEKLNHDITEVTEEIQRLCTFENELEQTKREVEIDDEVTTMPFINYREKNKPKRNLQKRKHVKR